MWSVISQSFAISKHLKKRIEIKWLLLYKGNIYLTMCYMCSEIEEKSGFDLPAIICIYVPIPIFVSVPTKILPLFAPNYIIIIKNT